MSVIGNTNPTMQDVARRLDPGGRIDKIVEIFHQKNGILDDMTVMEGNETTGHRSTQRTGLPEVFWRKLNQGVPQSKSRTQQITDSIGMLEAYANVDKDLAMLNGNTAEWRFSEDMAFLEAMNQEMAETMIYGDTSFDPEEFMGLAPRYNTPSIDPDNIGYQMITGGGSGADNTSIWLVVWSPNTVFSAFPKGSKAGLVAEDLGQDTLTDADGNQFEGFKSHYQWKNGLVVKDWRYVVRYANIDVSALTKDASGSSTDLVDGMTQMVELVEDTTSGRAAFYVSRKISSVLRRQINNANNVRFGIENIAGKKVTTFDGIPVRKVEKILETEATIAGTFAHAA